MSPLPPFFAYEFRDLDAALEMTHEFFARLLAGNAIATADPERGRFRSYLPGAVKHFLLHHVFREEVVDVGALRVESQTGLTLALR